MSVVVIGGNDRMASRYKDICESYRCKAKVFTQMPADLSSKLGTPDLMVVFTNTCSHKMESGKPEVRETRNTSRKDPQRQR